MASRQDNDRPLPGRSEARAAGAAASLHPASGGDLILQTKFTFRRGQDHRLPYDPAAPIRTQVEQSFASSLEHLGTAAINFYPSTAPPRGRPGRGRLGGLVGDGRHPQPRPGPSAGRQK